MLKGKRIILGISGGIAAYKCGELVRQLIQAGAEVRCVCTKNGLEFITTTTLQTLSRNKVYCEVFEPVGQWNPEHVAHADWADAMIVAPATANIIGKFVAGIADDALSTTFLAFDKPIFVAPTMNTKMYDNKIVQRNIEALKEYGAIIIDPCYGELACNAIGRGRMEEPENIVKIVEEKL